MTIAPPSQLLLALAFPAAALGERRDDRLAGRAARPASARSPPAGRPPASTSSACTGAGPARCSSGRGRSPVAGAPGRRGARGRGPAGRRHGRARAHALRWRLGNPWWVGAVRPDRVPAARPGHAAARVLRLEPGRRRCPAATLQKAGAPRDRAAQRLAARTRRSGARARRYAPTLRFAVVHHTAGSNGYTRGRVGGDRPGDPALPREGKRLERHRLQLPRRPVRPGLRGPLRRDRPERGRRARARGSTPARSASP